MITCLDIYLLICHKWQIAPKGLACAWVLPQAYTAYITQQGLQLQIANQTKTPKHKHSCDLQNNDVTA